MIRRLLLLCVLILPWLPACAAETFYASAVPSGSIEVSLHPTEGIAAGSTRIVTFGVPFPRGSLTAAQLASVRVLRNGSEVAAYVDQLAPWRHRSNAGIDGQSVRIARIQIEHATAATYPNADSLTLEWGGSARALNRPVLLDPRASWHTVNSGSFASADNVQEPDVYAVLPRAWLAHGVLRGVRTTAFDPTNTNQRDDPAAMRAIANWPGTQEAERALKNNFYTAINEDDARVTAGNQVPYKTVAEPWLYDRAATMFVLYSRSGSFKALREAVRATDFYADRVNATGHFSLAAGDTKYAYNESMAYSYWLTGDATLLPAISRVVDAQQGFSHVWSPQLGFWTERHTAFKLLANVVAYEVTGSSTLRDRVTTILADLRRHQDGANGQVPTPRIDGGLYHTGEQHGDWGPELGASPWMSVLVTDAVVRAYGSGEDAATAQFLLRMGRYMNSSLVLDPEDPYGTGAPALASLYATLLNGGDAFGEGGQEEHSLEVAAHIAWAYYFSDLLGAPEPALRQRALDLYETYDAGVNFWIRPTAPASGLAAYRVSPPRKWGWEHRTADAMAFALGLNAPPPTLFTSGFE
ncbi:MAG TPA: hypothetical protein PLI00_02025 [Pseudomonadota bacterium]|nr:hypothetical protein [Xanthomonadales bacterium]MBP7416971.1 hypothetical protein [Xanthomonadales bacterium]HQW64768.1 hypothetical protein [Pseudomonadota bacterium]HQY35331.1 hypothetical protein [Pseudomonadota bacterium]HRA36400.1 hypothetical protein [Pseudomonadota bacterium]